MMTTQKWLRVHQKRIQHDSLSKIITFDECVTKINDYISSNSKDYYMSAALVTAEERNEKLRQLLRDYVRIYKPIVDGYIQNDQMEYGRLEKNLDDELTNYGILTFAMNDDEIDEIRINDYRTIWVERHGISQILRDSLGHRVVFESVEECMKLINKLLSFSKQTIDTGRNKALGNGITIEGYRVAAVGPAVTAAEKGTDQKLVRSPSAVIRKFSKRKFTTEDLVGNHTMSNEIARYIRILGKVGLNALIVGKTGSGKTVDLQLMVDGIPDDKRTISMERDSELKLRRYDAKGNMVNDVLQWEYFEPDDSVTVSKTMPTSENCFNQMMRMSPSTIILGELRSYTEFQLSLHAIDSGHNVMGTGHAGTPEEAVERVVQAVMASSPNMSREDVMASVCNNFNIIICQLKQNDGTRKLTQLCELQGVYRNEAGILVPKINVIFAYKIERGKRDSQGHFVGDHYQIGCLSQSLLTVIEQAGQEEEDLEILMCEASPDKPIRGTYGCEEQAGGIT